MKVLLFRLSVLLFSVTLLTPLNRLAAQASTGEVKGVVKGVSGEALSGASITVQGKKTGAISDANGMYSIKLSAGKHVIVVSYVGFQTTQNTVTVTAGESVESNFSLSSDATLTEVTVGSRSRTPRTVISTPVPVDIVRTKDVANFAQADLGQILTFAAPSFQSARQTVTDGTDHVDPASLRGLGPDQTLVLVNGKRRHNSALVNINGSVGRGSVGTDLNAIPASAIDHIEILRDGAAAQYGSDAIAGVINVVLKKNYNGFNIGGSFGENRTTQSIPSPQDLSIIKRNITDGETKQIDFDWGLTGKHNAYINVSGQWLKRNASNRGGIDNSPLLYYGNASLAGAPATINGSATTDPQKADFYRFLMNQDAAKASLAGFDRRDMIIGNSSSNNFLGFINAGTDISKNAALYLTAGIGHREGDATGNYRLPGAYAQQPVKVNGTLYYPNGFLPHIAPKIDDISVLLGSNIKLGKWNADISSVIGRNAFHFFVDKSGNASLAPNDNIQTSFDAGRLSFLQSTSNLDFSRKYDLKKAGDYFNVALGGEYRYENYKITAGEVNSYISGPRKIYNTQFATPVYPVTGISYIIPSGGTAANPTAPGAQVFPGYGVNDAIDAHRSVYAGYVDLETKLNKLTLGGAARFESYAEENNISYNKLSGKFTTRYEFSPMFAVRGSVSNGFRAPSLQQRYFQNTSTQFLGSVAQNTLTANNQSAIVRDAFGVQELKPETSTDYTLGFVGKIGNSFSYTVDGYLIKIKDRIVLSSAFPRSNALVNAILNDPMYHVDPSTSSVQFWTNAVNTETKGIDVVLTEKISFYKAGNLNLSLAGNFNRNDVIGKVHTNSKIDDAANNPSLLNPALNPANDFKNILFDRQQRSRIEVAQPKSKINFTANYTIKQWNVVVRAIRWGKVESINTVGNNPNAVNSVTGLYFNDVSPESDQTFSAKITTDIALTYKPCNFISATLGANNLFDVYPDQMYIDPRNTLKSVYTTPVATVAAGGRPLGIAKAVGGYSASRDQTSRGRFLYFPNQFGFNGRYIYFKINVELGKMMMKKK